MSESERLARVRVVPASRPTVEMAVAPGTSLEKALRSATLVNVVRGIGPRGCETCISGREFLVNIYEEVTSVEFEE